MSDLLREPHLLTRIDVLAERIGYDGPDAREKVLKRAIIALESQYPARRQLTPEEQAKSGATWARIFEWGRRYREQNPYDPANLESKVLQDELYDEHGLPK